jgi:pilus assembly protein CpaF
MLTDALTRRDMCLTEQVSFLNCLTAAIPSRERVVTREEVVELKVPLPDVMSLQCRQPSLEGTGEIKLRRLVKEALRMRPSRIVVGEVRQEEVVERATPGSTGLRHRACQSRGSAAGREWSPGARCRPVLGL